MMHTLPPFRVRRTDTAEVKGVLDAWVAHVIRHNTMTLFPKTCNKRVMVWECLGDKHILHAVFCPAAVLLHEVEVWCERAVVEVVCAKSMIRKRHVTTHIHYNVYETAHTVAKSIEANQDHRRWSATCSNSNKQHAHACLSHNLPRCTFGFAGTPRGSTNARTGTGG